jgi:quinol-cytochrome oxidoreductase complex cytochrome b subunit
MSQGKPLPWIHRIIYTSKERGDERSRLLQVANNLVLHLHPTAVPAPALSFTYTWGLGGISATLAFMLAITGLMLMFRYDARVDYAYASIQELETQVAFGSLVRGVHHWSANLLVVTTFLHLVRVFLTGSFKGGRAMNWWIGLGLLLLVLASNFTGYLLPWDQLAYWAVTVSTSLLAYLPAIGQSISKFLLAGPQVGQSALSNFYAIHVVVLPTLMVGITAYHFWKVRKNGGISQPARRKNKRVERLTTIPNLVERELVVIITAVVLWSMFVSAPLGEIANAKYSPNPAKAAWYFLGLQELLLHMHPLAAILLVSIVLLGLALLPNWDRREADIGVYFRSVIGRQAAIIGAFLGLVLIPLLVIANEYWIDLSAMLPNWPILLSNGLIPLVFCLLGLAANYVCMRLLVSHEGQRANHSEALVGLFAFIFVSLIVLTIIGNLFRGANMALVLSL